VEQLLLVERVRELLEQALLGRALQLEVQVQLELEL
jgi:hypothetical protein